jgi:serine/threonine-protein kinase
MWADQMGWCVWSVWGVGCVVALFGCGPGASDAADVGDAGVDVPDTRVDVDVGVDVGVNVDADAGADVGVDVAADSGVDVVSDVGDTSGGEVGPWFTTEMAWDRPVDGLAAHADSEAMIEALAERGGWGNSNRFQVDFSIRVLEHDGSGLRTFVPTDEFYEPDCDEVAVPVPAGGALEGESGYACESDGDCHLIVRDRSTDRLFEMWRANIVGDDFWGGCLAVWDLAATYPPSLRGEGCTSADAAGLPIAPLLFTADEVAAGQINHAIRFILPNSRIAHRQYVRPATHATGAASAQENGMPYGVRLRLREDYPVDDLPSAGARVVARALQRYGMILADGGQIALTAMSDADATASWEGLLGPRDLAALGVTDFEVVDMGSRFDWTGDCERNSP